MLHSRGLVGLWRMEGDSKDGSGKGRTGSDTAISYVTGKSGKAASFNGASSHIDFADADDFSFTDGSGHDLPFTIAFWVYKNSTANGWFISKRNGGADPEWQFFVYGGNLTLSLFDSGVTSRYIQAYITDPLGSGAWHHIACTYDGSEAAAGIKFYMDAMLLSTTPNTVGPYSGMSNLDSVVVLGMLQVYGQNLNGLLDEVAVWKGRCLLQPDIRRVMLGLPPIG